MRKPNTSGGGANTNRNGLEFERGTELRDAFVEHERYEIQGDTVIDRATNLEIGVLFEKRKLYDNLLKKHGLDWRKLISKQLLPDGAILVGGTLYIIEKKFQSGAGSVDEKLQTGDFKKRQYERLVAPLGLNVKFYFLLSDWFKADSYRDVLAYIEEVGCRYFFKEIPLAELGL